MLFVFFGFNSMKVRLEPFTSLSQFLKHMFQFHEGTIRTTEKKTDAEIQSSFNSMKVRLELSRAQEDLASYLVSIP